MVFGWERLDFARRRFLCVVRRLVPWSVSWKAPELPQASIWIPFVRAFNNQVKTLVPHRLNALLLDARSMSVLACGRRSSQASAILGAQILASELKESTI